METKYRTKQEISNDYTQHAALLGDRIYRQGMLQAEIIKLHEQMNKITQEITSEQAEKLEAATEETKTA